MNIKVKIDVTKIEKSELYTGQKGTYLNVVLIEQPNEYSDGFIVQEISKERRDRGERGAILGNWNYIKPKQQPAAEQSYQAQPVAGSGQVNNGLPF